MSLQPSENLPTEAQLALAHTPPAKRDPLRIFLELDHRLGRIVAATSEPMLGQMRVAWWRERLMEQPQARPAGDAVLDAIGAHFAGREAALIALVDGWEHILADAPLTEAAARSFAEGRRDGLMGVYDEFTDPNTQAALGIAGWRWALADLASKVSLDAERDLLVRLGIGEPAADGALPREARGVAVLGALGLRALKRGGRPLMDGRGASLVATRAAILGR